jgi:acetamidase/formamidase
MILFGVFVVIAAVTGIAQFGRGRSILEKWAAENGYVLISSERRSVWRGPFFITTARGQEVFRITVRDAAGEIRSGYLRVGSFMLGVISDQASVRWDAEPARRPGFPVVVKERGDGQQE